MEQTTQFDANDAFAQVRQQIQGLMSFNAEDYQDDVTYTVNRLVTVLRMVQDNYQSWSEEWIREYVLSKHDPLRNIDYKSETFLDKVRKIQQEIIGQFSLVA
jgi:hypothetical protein